MPPRDTRSLYCPRRSVSSPADANPRLQTLTSIELPLCPQILVELAELQDAEVGDGTTSVVIIAAELLKRANELVRNKIHPTNIIAGYRLAMREVSRGGRLFAVVAAATWALLARAHVRGRRLTCIVVLVVR